MYFVFFYMYLSTLHIFAVKYINFTCIFGEKLLLFDWPKLYLSFYFYFVPLADTVSKFSRKSINKKMLV